MLRLRLTFYFLSFAWLLLGQQLSPKTNNYEINLRLDIDSKQVLADQILSFTNPSNDTIWDLQFHLYYNAFKNSQSTFYQEQGGRVSLNPIEPGEDCGCGWSEVLSIVDENGKELISGAEYIQPDDDNVKDQSVLKVTLDNPILPADNQTFKMKWKSQIPQIRPRTGFNKDFYFFAQWYPKLGVYEPAGYRYSTEGKWNCHQYHASGEYFGEFGDYKVTMDVPADYVVASSGQLQNKANKDDRTAWTFLANDIIDFSWGTSPKFIVREDKWQDVDLKLYTYDEHEACGDKYFKIVKDAFSYLDEHVGNYPYSTFSIIDAPLHGIFTGGMEYPTLITSINLCFLPSGFRTTETLTTHELIHQYFMQMVASHEVEEPWMDEGFTTYWEGRILDHFYGKQTSFVDWAGIKIGNTAYNRGEFLAMDNPKIAPVNTMSWKFKHGGYGPIAYNKTAAALRTLEGIIGRSTIDKIFKTYFEQWKFKHPCGRDFRAIANSVTTELHGDQFGADLNWFFDQTFDTSYECDYAMASIENEEIPKPAGYFDDLSECVELEAETEATNRTEVVIHRLGELKFPQEILITFDDGSSILEKWDGRDRSVGFEYLGKRKVIRAEIDPNRKIYLDKNFSNNSKTLEKSKKGLQYYFNEFLEKALAGLQAISIFV